MTFISRKNIKTITDVFSDIFDDPFFSSVVDDAVKINDEELSGSYRLAIPGYGKDDVRVTKKGRKLLVYVGDSKSPKKTLFLPTNIDVESISTEVENGVLSISYSRQENAEEEEIEIK